MNTEQTTRRNFLSCLSWLPGMALLSSWMARPVEASDEPRNDENLIQRRGVIEELRAELHAAECKADAYDQIMQPMCRVIRWIPVTETDQLPVCDRDLEGNPYVPRHDQSYFGLQARSRSVLVTSGAGVLEMTRWMHDDGHCDWGMNYTTVTHWAELPSAPEPPFG